MGKSKVDVDFRRERIILHVGQVSDAILHALGEQVVDEYKPRAAVDTGFMRASAYVVTRQGSTYDRTWPSGRYWSPKERRQVKRQIVPERGIPPGYDGLIVVGANYTVYVEVKQPALYPAATVVARRSRVTIERIGKQRLK